MNDSVSNVQAPSPNSIAELSTMNNMMSNSIVCKEGDAESPPLWLITFTDIMALMLTFFVLLYSMSVPEVEKWDGMSDSINKGLSKFSSPPDFSGAQDSISIEKLDMREALNLEYLHGLIEAKMKEEKSLNDISLISADDRIIISMPENLLFQAGQDEVKLEGKKALFALGGLLSHIRNRIEIVGHSDPRPITNQTSKFTSNWDLSLARAVQVSTLLMQAGYGRNMIVRGMSSARYDELPATLPEDQRLDLSRRVDIVVMQDDGGMRSFLQIGKF